jgi:integrase
MRIRRRTNGYWYGVATDGSPISLRTRDKDEATRRAADISRAPQGDSVAAIVEAYLAHKADKPGIDGMRDAWKAAAPHFGPLRPEHINRVVCRAYWQRRAGRSNGTIIKELGLVKAACRWADPKSAAIFEMPKAPPARDSYMTKADYRRLFFASRSPHFKVWLALAWYTAGRKEALLDLTWDRANIDTGKVRLGADVGKKGRAPVIPMARALRRILTIAKRGATSEWVVEFASRNVADIKKAFALTASRAGLTHLTPHDVRRSAGRHMIENGVSIEQVSQLLGHKDINTTRKHYAQFSPDFLRGAVSVL